MKIKDNRDMTNNSSRPRPTVIIDCPPPWEVAAGLEALETAYAAGARHGVKPRKMLNKATEEGVLLARARPGATLPSTTWDRMASLCIADRRPDGPKASLAARRALEGKESADHAALRLGVHADSLRGRARAVDGSKAAREPALWDALAAEILRRGLL